jgi:hypothetical protein
VSLLWELDVILWIYQRRVDGYLSHVGTRSFAERRVAWNVTYTIAASDARMRRGRPFDPEAILIARTQGERM